MKKGLQQVDRTTSVFLSDCSPNKKRGRQGGMSPTAKSMPYSRSSSRLAVPICSTPLFFSRSQSPCWWQRHRVMLQLAVPVFLPQPFRSLFEAAEDTTQPAV